MRIFNKISLFILLVFVIGCKSQYSDVEDGIYAEFKTNKGTMLAKLFYNKVPVTSANFISLAEGTNPLVNEEFKKKKFYNNLIFHRVMDSFMIQGGDPRGTGLGNPGYRFMDEFHPELKHDSCGVLSMANSGPKTNGSQFFITEVATPWLDNRHTVFGKLIDGFDVHDSISNVEVDRGKKPLEDIVIEELNIIRKGWDAKKFNAPEIFENHFAEEEQRVKDEKERKAQIKLSKKLTFEELKKEAFSLPSGLKYYILEKGTGEKLKETSKAMVDYGLFLEDGTLKETSSLKIAEDMEKVSLRKKQRLGYKPLKANLSPNAGMVAGFSEGLKQLNVGDKAILFVPYHLGYGDIGRFNIPPKTNLIYEIEVLGLAK